MSKIVFLTLVSQYIYGILKLTCMTINLQAQHQAVMCTKCVLLQLKQAGVLLSLNLSPPLCSHLF